MSEPDEPLDMSAFPPEVNEPQDDLHTLLFKFHASSEKAQEENKKDQEGNKKAQEENKEALERVQEEIQRALTKVLEAVREKSTESQTECKNANADLRKDVTEIIINLLSIIKTTWGECNRYTNDCVSEVKADVGALSERVSLLEGYYARLAELEVSFQELKVSAPQVPLTGTVLVPPHPNDSLSKKV